MTTDTVLNIASETIWVIIAAAAPLLLISLVIGLVVSIFQTITSIQEQTLTFIPKILATMLGLLAFGPYILQKIVTLMESLWGNFGEYI